MQPGNPKIRVPKEQKKSIGEAMFKFVPYWPIFVILIAVSMAGAWYYLRITPKMYEAAAAIMIKDETKGDYNTDQELQLDPMSDKKIIENEVEVLKSKTLMNDVVKNLHLYASFFEESDMAPKPAYTSSPVTIEAASPESITTVKKVEFSFSDKDSQVIIGSNRYPLNQFVKTNFGSLKFVPNKRYSVKALKPLYFSLLNPKAAADGFASKFHVTSTKVSTVVTMNFRDFIPERSEDILNELINVYNKSSIDEKKRVAASTLNFVNERLAAVDSELSDVEKRAQLYKKDNGAVDISQQGQNYLKSTSEIDTKLSDINMQLAVLDEVDKYLQTNTGTGANLMPSTLGMNDPILTDLLNKLTEKGLQYEKLKKTTGENNPVVTSIQGEINKLKPAILENIKGQRASLEASKLNLHSTNNTYSTMLQSIPQKERDLIQISREQAIKSGIYSFLRQKKEESELSVQHTLVDTRIVDRAQASIYPVSPKSSMIYVVAFIFALALPVGFISLKGMLNRKIVFRQEIETITSFPIIGEVMLDNSKDPMVIKEGKRTFIAEQFRKIRTSLAYLGVNHSGKKRVLVTSSLSGEGKSFVALNLALSLAMTGKKVILLELDLANPSLSKKLDVTYEKGVSNYLWGECEPEEVIKRTTANNNLFFMPAGQLPDNPSELLMNDRLKELLDYLEDIFDHVIIDSAPASLLTDAYVLSPMCHATLYVVKHKFTPKVYLERLEQENSMNQLQNLGIIFNGIKSRGFTKNGYGYGYGYGYIHDNSGKKGKEKKKAKA